ncbi:flagellar biosynthetic protein FliQ [Alkalibaculum bacchi]|uniref:Flagellar biosynthetic protein FliQ n=1 Tax=Alkalibaculum bacchi TaxID=645887 RepID=A0A366IFD8_9FIRM|nr:flagellar biosynthesis protein FliQ [Alkalibaculum bacchi]RBP70093.1 flagellar biosynthetic protein FliQ [Alkalibaculum bacchi]
MTQTLVLDIMRNAFFTIVFVSGPVLIIALIVGLIISILQATTQIQEQTLSFVPKIVAVMVALIVFGSFMLNTLISFTGDLFKLIPTIS